MTVARAGPTSAISRKKTRNAAPVQITPSPASASSTWTDGVERGQVSAAAVVYAPLAALTWPRTTPSVQVLLALAGLGVICTAAAFLVFFRLIAEVGPARATVITYVNPAVAVALGVIILGEPLTPAIGAAFVLILGGSVLATRAGRAGRRGTGAAPDEVEPMPAGHGDTEPVRTNLGC